MLLDAENEIKHCTKQCQTCVHRHKKLFPAQKLPKKPAGHTVKNWLELHEIGPKSDLDGADVRRILRNAKMRFGAPMDREVVDLSLDQNDAIALVLEALTSKFPSKKAAISDVARRLVIKQIAGSVAYTTEIGGKILIASPYRNCLVDLLNLAHEIGHGLQLVECHGQFMPPMARELAAFIAELCLIDFLFKSNHLLAHAVLHEWQKGTHKYLSTDSDDLLAALEQPEKPYTYKLNYPLARLASANAFAWLPEKLLWKAFIGAIPMAAVFETVEVRCAADLKPIHVENADYYRNIGCKYQEMELAGELASNLTMIEVLDRVAPDRTMRDQNEANNWIVDQTNIPTTGYVDRFVALGLTLTMLAQSSYHGMRPCTGYIKTQVAIPLRQKMARIYIDKAGHPAGFISWARLSDKIEAALIESGKRLGPSDWNSGTRPFIYDWISKPFATARMVQDVTNTLFADFRITGLRRSSSGKVRKISQWRGANLRP